MPIGSHRRKARLAAVAVGSLAAVSAATLVPAQGSSAPSAPAAAAQGAKTHRVILSGLDNPRQLSLTPNGAALVVAQAGHGGRHCVGSGEDQTCIGRTGAVTKIKLGGRGRDVMTGLLSGSGPDGSFATGADGASKRLGGQYFTIMTYAPPEFFPKGVPGRQAGKLLAARPGGKLRVVANISRFEERHDPDGEGFDSNPYSVLALKRKVLVADAAGDYIAQVNRKGKVSLWALMPEYGKRVDAVPTVVTKGNDGFIYVGELHSEQPRKAKVWKFDRQGNRIRSWGGFTTVTGVARGKDGTLYVSELFGGCGFDKIPTCFPGRVVRVKPNGDRSSVRVPFPAGVAVKNGRVFVNAFSVSTAQGTFGPGTDGQVWRVFFK
jgi:hypothetical protein